MKSKPARHIVDVARGSRRSPMTLSSLLDEVVVVVVGREQLVDASTGRPPAAISSKKPAGGRRVQLLVAHHVQVGERGHPVAERHHLLEDPVGLRKLGVLHRLFVRRKFDDLDEVGAVGAVLADDGCAWRSACPWSARPTCPSAGSSRRTDSVLQSMICTNVMAPPGGVVGYVHFSEMVFTQVLRIRSPAAGGGRAEPRTGRELGGRRCPRRTGARAPASMKGSPFAYRSSSSSARSVIRCSSLPSEPAMCGVSRTFGSVYKGESEGGTSGSVTSSTAYSRPESAPAAALPRRSASRARC